MPLQQCLLSFFMEQRSPKILYWGTNLQFTLYIRQCGPSRAQHAVTQSESILNHCERFPKLFSLPNEGLFQGYQKPNSSTQSPCVLFLGSFAHLFGYSTLNLP